jgi:hypothetical protein
MNDNILSLNFRPEFPCPYLYDYLHTLWNTLLNEQQKVEKSRELIKIIDIDFKYDIPDSNTRSEKLSTVDISEVEEICNSVINIFNKCLEEIIQVLNHINGTNKEINKIKRIELFQKVVYPTEEIVKYINKITDLVKYYIDGIINIINILYSLDFKPVEDIEHNIFSSLDKNGYFDAPEIMKGGGKKIQNAYKKILEIKNKLNLLSNTQPFDQSTIKNYSNFTDLDQMIELFNKLKTKLENMSKETELKYFDIDLTQINIPDEPIDMFMKKLL